jgi:hypothetical protein
MPSSADGKFIHVKPMPDKSAMRQDLLVRIQVVEPPPGVPWALQLGRSDLLPPVKGEKGLKFEATIRLVVNAHGDLDFRGPAVQGPRGGRFVYLTSGVRAGQLGSIWDRRAKVSLEGLREVLASAPGGASITTASARIAGAARDGGPACASVPLLDEGWRVELQG